MSCTFEWVKTLEISRTDKDIMCCKSQLWCGLSLETKIWKYYLLVNFSYYGCPFFMLKIITFGIKAEYERCVFWPSIHVYLPLAISNFRMPFGTVIPFFTPTLCFIYKWITFSQKQGKYIHFLLKGHGHKIFLCYWQIDYYLSSSINLISPLLNRFLYFW